MDFYGKETQSVMGIFSINYALYRVLSFQLSCYGMYPMTGNPIYADENFHNSNNPTQYSSINDK